MLTVLVLVLCPAGRECGAHSLLGNPQQLFVPVALDFHPWRRRRRAIQPTRTMTPRSGSSSGAGEGTHPRTWRTLEAPPGSATLAVSALLADSPPPPPQQQQRRAAAQQQASTAPAARSAPPQLRPPTRRAALPAYPQRCERAQHCVSPPPSQPRAPVRGRASSRPARRNASRSSPDPPPRR